MDYKKLFDQFPISDVHLADAIGISVKTLKRLRSGKHKPRSGMTQVRIMDYIYKLNETLSKFIK